MRATSVSPGAGCFLGRETATAGVGANSSMSSKLRGWRRRSCVVKPALTHADVLINPSSSLSARASSCRQLTNHWGSAALLALSLAHPTCRGLAIPTAYHTACLTVRHVRHRLGLPAGLFVLSTVWLFGARPPQSFPGSFCETRASLYKI